MLTKEKIKSMNLDPEKMKWSDQGYVEWNKMYDHVICHNKTILSDIPYAKLIYQGIDLDFWQYKNERPDNKTVLMVAARIEGKKGVKEVAIACKELDFKFILVGRISDPNYFSEIKEANPDIDFRENITDEQLRDAYYESNILVCNSIDNFESGPMPVLEAMACGTPVLTRNVGHIPDLYADRENMIIRTGQPSDLEDLKTELRMLMRNYMLRDKISRNAWETVKNKGDKKMARLFEGVFYEVKRKSNYFVSVIVPTFDRPKVLIECLSRIVKQDYPCFEVIVSDSGNESVEEIVKEFRSKTNIPIKYIRFENHGEYTLAKARNLGIIESNCQLIVFCDERIGMEDGCIIAFAKNARRKRWLYGIKDEYKKGFVENLSAIFRDELIFNGMFNERIDCYGGMTQEIRDRLKNKLDFEFVREAKGSNISKARSIEDKRKDIVDAKFTIFKLYN